MKEAASLQCYLSVKIKIKLKEIYGSDHHNGLMVTDVFYNSTTMICIGSFSNKEEQQSREDIFSF